MADDVRVQCASLDDGAFAVLVEHGSLLAIGLDDRHATPELAAALQGLLQDALDSGRWVRRGEQPGRGAIP